MRDWRLICLKKWGDLEGKPDDSVRFQRLTTCGGNESNWISDILEYGAEPLYHTWFTLKMYKVKATTVAHYCPVVQELLLVWKTWDEWDNGKHKKIKNYCFHCDRLIK